MSTVKSYRKTIRMNGNEVKSPRFARSSDAEKWYQLKLREKQHVQAGIDLPVDDETTLNNYFDHIWFPDRVRSYPKATWYSDEQRFNTYIRDGIGRFKIARISQLQIRVTLKNVVDVHELSTATRNKVRSLISKIFNDAMNNDPPLRRDNPAYNISFKDSRKGKKTPEHIRLLKDIIKFITEAKKLGPNHYTYAVIALMSGLRKSEIIPLRWNDCDFNEAELKIDEKFEQASNQILSGTKAGSDEARIIPMPDDLIKALRAHKKQSDYQGEDDFILCTPDGSNLSPKQIHELHDKIRKAAGVIVTPHGLRHTFGRQFVVNDGNLKVLQAIMGHSNSTTTDLYSELAGRDAKKSRNTVNLGLDDLDDE